MNAFGPTAHHTVLSATTQFGARDAIFPHITTSFPTDSPSLQGKPGIARYRRLARYMAGFDLILTYNWGAMDVVAARRLFARTHRLPPLIHHEDGFNSDEAERQKPARIWFRRLMLPAARHVVVPSRTLEEIARQSWRQPARRVVRIGNGIAVGAYAEPPQPAAIPGLERRPGELVVGTIAGLRSVKNLPRLVRIFAQAANPQARLVIVGEGPERAAILAAAAEGGIQDQILLPGFLPDPHRYIGHFNIFALTSDSEQFPIALVEAMAAGLPCVASCVGDVAEMLPPGNVIAAPGGEEALAAGLAAFLASPERRRSAGDANRAKAAAEYDEQVMIARYAALYGEAIGRPHAFRGGTSSILPAAQLRL
jgi:glycosyltransferase involved in cell wall biosynthesis